MWNLGWYLCMEFRMVCTNKHKHTQLWSEYRGIVCLSFTLKHDSRQEYVDADHPAHCYWCLYNYCASRHVCNYCGARGKNLTRPHMMIWGFITTAKKFDLIQVLSGQKLQISTLSFIFKCATEYRHFTSHEPGITAWRFVCFNTLSSILTQTIFIKKKKKKTLRK